MKLFKFIASKTFWANIVLALFTVSLIVWGLFAWLGHYTHHDQNIEVPDLRRLSFEEASDMLTDLKLDYSVRDTAEFTTEFPRGSIIAHYPEFGATVKQGRKIKLTINPLKPKKIALPDLVEKTKRRAIYDLSSKGFKVGELMYVPYIGKDVVIDVKVNGSPVEPNTKLDKGTVIDLVLGQGPGKDLLRVPYLRWKSLADAKQKLLDVSLNLGAVEYDEGTDTAVALVYRQYPEPTLNPKINMGADVDIWLTDDYTKIPNDSLVYLNIESPDTLYNELSDTLPE